MFPEIRPARLADAALIARMSRSLIERGLTWRWTPQAVAPHIRDSETAAVVAWADDRMLGFAIMGFRFLHSEAHMLLLAVDPAARRSGVGRALWRWLETIARRGGIGRVELEVRAENSGGRAFYHALGFREVARLRDYYESREDALRMVADLRAHCTAPPTTSPLAMFSGHQHPKEWPITRSKSMGTTSRSKRHSASYPGSQASTGIHVRE